MNIPKVNCELISYIEHKIFPLYAKNEPAHNMKHIYNVINRSIELSEGYNVNLDMVYTIASYHDIGHHIDAKNHEKESANIMISDFNLKKFFNDDELLIIKEAIEDHRASLDKEPRTIYGKIVSSADRSISIDDAIERSYIYGLNHFPWLSPMEAIDRVYNHLFEKFGEDGYAKVYIMDNKYRQFLNEIDTIFKNKESFIKRMEKVIDNLKNGKNIY
jgi:uncharacterized protein